MKYLQQLDPLIYQFIREEEKRQKDVLEMIPSENYTSASVREAMGSVLINKYSEGYPKKRYYQGNKIIDSVEVVAQERAQKLFEVPYVNVQPYSGSPANAAIYMALLEPGQKIMGLALDHGGHITHGLEKIGFSGKFFQTAHYRLDKATQQLDYADIEQQIMAEKPDLLICGFTAYPRIIQWDKFRKIADKVGCWLMADISHIAGLIVGGVHPSPVPYVDVIMTTTHKTLRGPRGAMIMVTENGIKKDPQITKKIDTAVFPGLQGGPHDNQTAAIAVALQEASLDSFKEYAQQVVANAKLLSTLLMEKGLGLVSEGTENHLLLINLQEKQISGKVAAEALEEAGIIVNYNLVPYDPMPPFYTSGIRLGTPAITTRGMGEQEMKKIAEWIPQVIEEIQGYVLPQEKEERAALLKTFRGEITKNKTIKDIALEVKKLCKNFPVY